MRNSAQLMSTTLLALALTTPNLACVAEQNTWHPVKVEIVKQETGYQFLRGGKPYRIRGAGINHTDLETFAANGGNSFRTWAVDDGALPAQELLDRAQALGLTVSLGLEFASERHGYDYDDSSFVAKQFEETRQRVLKYRDHPALLSWFIGNELNFDFNNAKVYTAVNDVSKMIHELDPNHPTTTTLSQFNKELVDTVQKHAPDLDFLSFQLYGDLINMPKYIEETKFTDPYFVTEWGAIGHWEVANTTWGAPVEQTSTEKAASYANSYRKVLEPFPEQALGNYVFLWGQKQERTATWYGMFLDSGEATETVDVMYQIWNGHWPENRTPQISRLKLNGRFGKDSVIVESGKTYDAAVNITELDDDPVTYRWEVLRESSATEVGGDVEYVPEQLENLIANSNRAEIEMKAPPEQGAYRLFVYAYDGKGHAAHANIPFFVQ
ncbi:MAG: hypothetical protein ACI9GW_003036 [Halieaceae bacterium]|jgi:hypothetical protein